MIRGLILTISLLIGNKRSITRGLRKDDVAIWDWDRDFYPEYK